MLGVKKKQLDREGHRQVARNRKRSHSVLFAFSAVFTLIYIIWRIFFTIPTQHGAFTLVIALLLLGAEIMAAIESLMEYRQMNIMVEPELPVIPDAWFPDVDVLIATHNESVDLLYKTVNACTYLNYPDKSKVHIYICDDTDRPAVAELAKKLGVGYFGLAENEHAKAGNLNNALRQTSSPLVVTLDSDMIPMSDFLLKTAPYFFLPVLKKDKRTGLWVRKKDEELDPDYKIGFVQTPQSFYNPDLFQFNLYSEGRIPNEQDYFFREVNVARNADNGAIYAGSNTMLSREALQEVGYIATTSITEDFLTGIRIQKKGYTTYAVQDELAHGLAPDSVISLMKQRERWGRGCMQGMRQENMLFTTKLPLRTKMSYIAAWMYWWTFLRRMIYIMSPILTILFSLNILEANIWQVLIFWLPHYLLYNQTLKVLSRGVRNQHWSNVYDTIMFPYLVSPILLETLGLKKRKFVVTDKQKKTGKEPTFSLALPHLLLLVTSVWSIVLCVQESIVIRGIYNPIVLFWLAINIKNLLFAIFFMYGRSNGRMAERYYVGVPVELDYDGEIIHAETSDISESGLALMMERPIYVPPDKKLKLKVRYKKYTAEMEVTVVHIIQSGEKWKYSVHIEEVDSENMSRYMQIVYDRGHTMPRHLDPSLSIFDDFSINLSKRVTPGQSSMRRLPRIRMGIPFQLRGEEVVLMDFNYYYVRLDHDVGLNDDEALVIKTEPDVTFRLSGTPIRMDEEEGVLYKLENREDFTESPHMEHILDVWLEAGSGRQYFKTKGKIVPRSSLPRKNKEEGKRSA